MIIIRKLLCCLKKFSTLICIYANTALALITVFCVFHVTESKGNLFYKTYWKYPGQVAHLSQRDSTAGRVSFWPKVVDWNWETIFSGHYGSIFNHCDIIGLQSYRIR